MNTRTTGTAPCRRLRWRLPHGNSFFCFWHGITVILLGMCLPGIAFANQQPAIFAELAGEVKDASGMPVAGAIVVLHRIHGQQSAQTLSGQNGGFRLLSLAPGEYELRVMARGYRAFRVKRLPLVAGDVARAEAVLVFGNAEETIEGAVNSVVSRAGTALAGKNVSDLPENQRNFVNAVQVSGGANEGSTNSAASGTNSRPGAQHESSAVSLGGQPEKANSSLIDGVDNNERINSELALHPSVDAVADVQVLASAYPADVGRAGGGAINVITRSGTNRFHGSAYEYFRNDVLDAYPFQFGAHNRKPELRQNQFGGSLSGPFLHNLFFFGDYEGFRLIQGRAPVELTVPTAYEHDHPGNFSDVSGPLITSFDPVGLAYFKLYPLPNVAGSTNQFVSANSGSNVSQVGDLRVDRTFADGDSLFGRFSYNRTLVFIPGQFPAVQQDGMTIAPGGSLTSFPGNMDDRAVNVALSYTHVFNPHVTIALTSGYMHWSEKDSGLNPSAAVNAGFGQPGINLPQTSNGLAPIDVLQAAPLGNDGYYRPINQGDTLFQYGGDVTWTTGVHQLHIGSQLLRRDWRNIGSGFGLGFWVVKDLPSLLQGQFLQVQREVDLANAHYQAWEPSAYIQDEWNVTHHLLLSAGLRYDVFTPPVEIRNQLSNFDLSTGALIVAGVNGVSRTADVRTDYSGIAPRFGFAWHMLRNTALKGGYGIVPFRPIDSFVYKAPPSTYSFGVCSSLNCPNGFTTLAAGLPFAQPSVNNPNGVLLGMRSFRYLNSYMEQFNLGLEQQIAGNTVHVFYVGSLGQHLARSFPDINAPPPNTAVNPNLLRPFYSTVPNLTSIVYFDTEAWSNYDALQVSVAHQYAKGLTVQFNYTWAHGLDNCSGGGFGTVPALSSQIDYGNSSVDVHSRLAMSSFYELPFGRRASGAGALLERSWQVNLAAIWATGLPFTVLNASDVSNTNPGAYSADRPNQFGNAALADPGVDRFFNTTAFAAQANGTLGNERSNQLYGPHTRRIDASLFKSIPVSKQVNLQFRAEVFNVTNTANFAAPAANLGGANFGELTQMTAGYTPREIQFALRLRF
jgi:hypothetical protein